MDTRIDTTLSTNLKCRTIIHLNNTAEYTHYGTKGNRRNSGSWIIALEDGTIIIQRYNPNVGQIRDINSYRADIYASLASTIFPHTYSSFYMVTLANKYIAVCDNQSHVNKLS